MSTTDRQSELNNAILFYICQCQANGDFRSLENLGITPDVLDMLKEMTVNEVLHICKIPSRFASIKIDNKLLGNLFNHVRKESINQELINKLIKHGAPLKLLRSMTGINAQEFSARRKLQNIDNLGRTQDPTPDQEMQIYDYWKNLEMKSDLTAAEWIEFSIQTDLPIRLIYKVICEEDSRFGQAN